MNSEQDNFFSSDIEALRSETPRPDAKAELILTLSQKRSNSMNILKKASIMTAITALAVVGGVTVLQPNVSATTPAKVAAALKNAANYTIKSFVRGEDGKPRIQSELTYANGTKTIKHFDENGKVVAQPKVRILGDKLSQFPAAKDSSPISIQLNTGSDKPAKKSKVNSQKIEVKVKIVNGVETKEYFVNGKKVDKLPSDVVNVNVNPGEGFVFKSGGPGSTVTRSSTQLSVIVLGQKEGKPIILQSGQTPSEYLSDLLSDGSKWNVERGVTYKGQRLDLFTLKGSMAPLELYVESSTSRPKYLIFKGLKGRMNPIEDVYEYGNQP